MKKVIFILVALISLSTTIFAQTTERKTLFKSKLGYEFIESVRESDTLTYFYFGYRNEKYKAIVDVGSILIPTKTDLQKFAETLIEFSQKPKGTDINYKHDGFSIYLTEGLSGIYIFDKKAKYTSLSKEKAKQLGEEILTKIDLLRL